MKYSLRTKLFLKYSIPILSNKIIITTILDSEQSKSLLDYNDVCFLLPSKRIIQFHNLSFTLRVFSDSKLILFDNFGRSKIKVHNTLKNRI
jgi:hypothetical protein